MKRYEKYMDSVEVSDTLHERLTNLTPGKRAPAWRRYGAMAAALTLVIGLGAAGLSKLDRTEPAVSPGIQGVAEPSGVGGYEVTGNDVVPELMLPDIVYNEPDNGTSVDYSLAPPGALSREATIDDVAVMVGGPGVMEMYLLWDGGLGWSGTLWFLEDGTPCAATLRAERDGVSFCIELVKDGQVPSCVVLPEEEYETTEFNGVEITALKNTGYAVIDGVEYRESREVSCFANGMGCKITIYGVDGGNVEVLCARFIRWAVVVGFDLSGISMEGAALAYDPDYEVGEPEYELD